MKDLSRNKLKEIKGGARRKVVRAGCSLRRNRTTSGG